MYHHDSLSLMQLQHHLRKGEGGGGGLSVGKFCCDLWPAARAIWGPFLCCTPTLQVRSSVPPPQEHKLRENSCSEVPKWWKCQLQKPLPLMDLSLSPFGADLLVEWVDKVRGGFGEGFLLGGKLCCQHFRQSNNWFNGLEMTVKMWSLKLSNDL